jgi:hypothetical protein
MSLRPEPLPPIPDATAAAVRAAFPKGNLYVDLRAEFGTLYTDQLLADLYPPQGRPVEVAPWRLALVVVMQYIEGLTDRQRHLPRRWSRGPLSRRRYRLQHPLGRPDLRSPDSIEDRHSVWRHP